MKKISLFIVMMSCLGMVNQAGANGKLATRGEQVGAPTLNHPSCPRPIGTNHGMAKGQSEQDTSKADPKTTTADQAK